MSWRSRGEGLAVNSESTMEAKIDDVVETAIRRGTLGPQSPYYGWSLQKFRASRREHKPDRKRFVRPQYGKRAQGAYLSEAI